MENIERAKAIVTLEDLLGQSRIPQVLWHKVRNGISIKDFILGGALEGERFKKAFKAEIEYWESRLFRSESITKKKGKTRSPEELIEYGRTIARRVTGYIRSDKEEASHE